MNMKETKRERMSRIASNKWYKEKRKKQKVWADYKSYLLSREWKIKRGAKLKSVGSMCESCRNIKNLQVHHKTYARIYSEKMEDLVVLCEICHLEKHNQLTEQLVEEKIEEINSHFALAI